MVMLEEINNEVPSNKLAGVFIVDIQFSCNQKEVISLLWSLDKEITLIVRSDVSM